MKIEVVGVSLRKNGVNVALEQIEVLVINHLKIIGKEVMTRKCDSIRNVIYNRRNSNGPRTLP